MFWSPAVATFSVCAPAGAAMRQAASVAAMTRLGMRSSLVIGAWEQVQGLQRQAQTDRSVEIEVAGIHHREMTAVDRHPVAVMAARIGSLADAAAQHDGVLRGRIRRDE